MKINPINIVNIAEKIDPNKSTSISNEKNLSSSSRTKDSVSFSSAAETVSKLAEKASQVPEVRTERVAALRQQIASGTFNPSSDEILTAIINNEKR